MTSWFSGDPVARTDKHRHDVELGEFRKTDHTLGPVTRIDRRGGVWCPSTNSNTPHRMMVVT